MFVADVGDGIGVLLERRVVDQDVELAEGVDGLLDGLLAKVTVANVAWDAGCSGGLRFRPLAWSLPRPRAR